MTLHELKILINSEPNENNQCQVKIWLPGSKISLVHSGTMIRQGNLLMIEGNVDEGSALLPSLNM